MTFIHIPSFHKAKKIVTYLWPGTYFPGTSRFSNEDAHAEPMEEPSSLIGTKEDERVRNENSMPRRKNAIDMWMGRVRIFIECDIEDIEIFTENIRQTWN